MRALCRLQLWLLAVAFLLRALPLWAADVDKLLPNDTETVFVVNAKQVLDAVLMKKYALDPIKDLLKNTGDVQAVLDALGFDPLKDVSTVVAASSSVGDNEKGLLIVHGKFDQA